MLYKGLLKDTINDNAILNFWRFVMGKIGFSSKIKPETTLVSNIFIDEYMPQADGSYVKVYLFLLRCFNSNESEIGISDIADILETTERDVLRAICYWEKKGLISTSRNSLNEICSIEFEIPTHETDINVVDNDLKPNTSQPDITPLYPDVSEKEVIIQPNIIPIESLLNDDNFLEMKMIIERMLERPINSIESNLIINLYTKYNFNPDLLIHLFEHCLSSNKTSSSLIEKIGMDWAMNGIDTVEKAQEYTLEYSDIYYGVIKAFGINNRSLGTSERQYIVKWISQYGYGSDIICEACSKTLSAIHQQSFEYADKILTSWHKENVHTLKDIEIIKQKKEASRNTFSNKQTIAGKPASRAVKNSTSFNFEQRDYSDNDFESLEKRALAKYLN